MPKLEPRDDPSTPSPAWEAMAGLWWKIQTVLNGTEAMRGADRAMLPQHSREENEAYQERVTMAVLENRAELTLNSWTGRPFSRTIQFTEDFPDEIKEWTSDIDLQGNNLATVARNWFREGLAKAFSHVLVDFPRTDTPEGRVRTLADDRRDNLRPYFKLLCPEEVISMRSVVKRGREVLTHVRIKEEHTVVDGYDEGTRCRIREMNLVDAGVHVLLHEEIKEKNKTIRWDVIDEWMMDIDEIPLVTFYADRQALMVGKPPLLDLVNLNIRHWQSNADQINILTVTRFPMLAASGAIDEKKMAEIGPRKMIVVREVQGRVYYIEHRGEAIGAGRTELKDLEEAMAHYGALFLTKTVANPTATARVMDSAESTSPLQDATLRFEDALNNSLRLLGKWSRIEVGGRAEVKKDFNIDVTDAELGALKDARNNGDISREAFLRELKRRGLLADDYDVDEDRRLLKKETGGAPPGSPPPIPEE